MKASPECPAKGERNKDEQIQRFILLPLALHVLKTATTLQGYRKRLVAVGIQRSSSRLWNWKIVQWWSFVAVFVKQDIRMRVVVRKVGDGKLHFWSVMLYTKRKRRLASRRVNESWS